MPDDRIDKALAELLGSYNAPPETPREEMWAALQKRLPEPRSDDFRLERARRLRGSFHRPFGWAVAAAALLMLGIGIGRMTAPSTPGVILGSGAERSELLRTAALQHLGRSESLLALVRADAHSGRLDPQALGQSRSLLTETRLLLDASHGTDPRMRELLKDLEFVLMQVVGAEESEVKGAGDAQTELDLAVRGMDQRELLPRIEAIIPGGPGRAGT